MIKPLTKKILLAIALVAILAAAFWWGGHTPGSQDQLAADANSADTSRQPAADTPDLSTDQEPSAAIEGAAPDMSNSASPSEEQKTPNSQKDEAESQSSGHGNTDTNNTAPTAANQDVWTCSLAVRCDTILDHLDYLNEAKRELIPSDGVIFSSSNVIFSEGESVLDVLLREMQSAGIPMEYVNTPGYGSAYIEGINNIYELDCGSLSGWMYRVNGVFPGYGCSLYLLEDGDSIEILYTCDLGADIGGSAAAGSQ